MPALSPAYLGLEPSEVWRHFSALNSIPRPSGHEDAARAYVISIAEAAGVNWKVDARGNCVVYIGARGAAAHGPSICLQAHLDMVCQQRPGVEMNFATDPIRPRREGDQIFATGTTLGADNGIGAAMALATLTAPNLVFGPLELLFTVEEETGLFGAQFLEPGMVKSRLMVNLDSEDPSEITIGCAGGAGTTVRLDVAREDMPADFVAREVVISGLKGGHSGIQIGEKLGNALKFLTTVLARIERECPDLRLVNLQGGTAHNAIPRDARALVALPATSAAAFEAGFELAIGDLCTCWRDSEPDLVLSESTSAAAAMLTRSGTHSALELLAGLPHGVWRMSEIFEGKVETSSNLAEAHLTHHELEIHVSNRSFLALELQAAQARVAEVADRVGARIEVRDGYPGWEPRADSPLREATEAAFVAANGAPAHVEVVHAGLECGILSEKLPGLDAVSFGPLIRGAHTPEEWVDIPSVGATWKVLTGLLNSLALTEG